MNYERLCDEIFGVIWPYIKELINGLLHENICVEEAFSESLAELICLRAEITVRKMVKEINEKARAGEFDEVKRLISENPEVARKAANYVAKRLKWRVRRIIEEELAADMSR